MRSFKPGDTLVPVRRSVNGNFRPELDTTSFSEVEFIGYIGDNVRGYDIEVKSLDKPIKYASSTLLGMLWYSCDFKLKSNPIYEIY